MRTRGTAIAGLKFDKVRESEEKVNELFLDFDKLTVPTAAFITFEEEDAKILAENCKSNKDLLGAPMRFSEASEPTDIIWENRHFTTMNYCKRGFMAGVVILILLGGSFAVVYIVSQLSANVSAVFPTSINCD